MDKVTEGMITSLTDILNKRIELIYEFDYARQAERLLDKHKRYYILLDDEHGSNSSERRYFLFDHEDKMRSAGSQSNIRSYIRLRNAAHLLIDKTKKTGKPNDFRIIKPER